MNDICQNSQFVEDHITDIKSGQSSLTEQIKFNHHRGSNNDILTTFYNRTRQFSCHNPTNKTSLEFPNVATTIGNTKHNFYNDSLTGQFTQNEQQPFKKSSQKKYRSQRSTSFNEGSNFYVEQSKTCNLNLQANDQNEVQSKFFKYFKTQMRIRKDSLKQFSDFNSENRSSLQSHTNRQAHESKHSLLCQNSVEYVKNDDLQINENSQIVEGNKNYLYEEGLDTIPDYDEVNRQCYSELIKNGNNKSLPPKQPNNNNTYTKNNYTNKSQQQELFISGDISPWQNNNQRVYHLLQSKDVNKKKDSRQSSTPFAQQSQNGYSRDSDRGNSQKNAFSANQVNASNHFAGGLKNSDSNMSIVQFSNGEDTKVNTSMNLTYLKTKSQLLSDPHQHIKQLQSLNSKNNENKIPENKEIYNFSKRNSKQFQNPPLKIQLKSCGQQQAKPFLGEIQNKQQQQQLQQIQQCQIDEIQELDEFQFNPIMTPIPQVGTPIVVDLTPLNGKENMPKFYNNLANTETKKSVFPKIQQQFNLYKPNTIIFQSNQKYKSQFDNSSVNFKECITFLPKNLKNKILKQLEK